MGQRGDIKMNEFKDENGCVIKQLTGANAFSNNIYCEQPYASADGRRIAVIRTDGAHSQTCKLLIIDLEKEIEIPVEPKISIDGISCCAWGNWLYYIFNKGNEGVLARVSYKYIAKEIVFFLKDCPMPVSVGSVSPDYRYYINAVYQPRFSVLRIDLTAKKWEIIHQHPEILNPHTQFNPVTGKDMLIQHNRGSIMDEKGNTTRLLGPEGCTLYLLDKDGKNKRELPVGPPHTASCTGHECFIADTGRILFSIVPDPNFPGNLLSVAPGDKKPSVVTESPHFLNHVSASKCGNYFVADTLSEDRSKFLIVMGSIKTGRHRVLCDTGTSVSVDFADWSHVHPYLTADNKRVIFNSDRTGVPQVYAAGVDPDFLKSLS